MDRIPGSARYVLIAKEAKLINNCSEEINNPNLALKI
jgi:hypothetical protein